jgi:hypothetical protein
MAIADTVCFKQGHNIQALRINDKLVPLPSGSLANMSFMALQQFEQRCVHCGLSLEEARSKTRSNRSGTHRPSQEKKHVDVRSTGTIETSQVTVSQSVPGTPTGVLQSGLPSGDGRAETWQAPKVG